MLYKYLCSCLFSSIVVYRAVKSAKNMSVRLSVCVRRPTFYNKIFMKTDITTFYEICRHVSSLVSQVFNNNPQGSRPRNRWWNCVQTDIKKCKINNWKER
jgi:hypothetical protein